MQEKRLLRIIRRACGLICHQKPERCFNINGYVFPLCARCTGIAISFMAAIICLYFKCYISLPVALIMLAIMTADWLIQFLKIKESTNTRRFITGLIGGFGLTFFYYYLIRFVSDILSHG